jgi:hypothetical protein
MALFIEIFGWIGSAAVVLAYALISTNRVQNSSSLYHLLNLGGSVGLIVNSTYNRAFPSTFVNLVWSLIALFAVIRIFQSTNRLHS